jgi:hypothetical protein
MVSRIVQWRSPKTTKDTGLTERRCLALRKERHTVALALIAVGAATTVPAALAVFSGP